MNEILFTLPLVGNNCGVLSCINNSLAADMQQRGWRVSVTNPKDNDFLLKIMSIGQNKNSILFLGHFFFDLRVSAQNHFKDTNIADLVQCHIGVKIGDHPFSKFMWERLIHTHERSCVFVPEPGFSDAARYLQPTLKKVHTIPPPISYAPRKDFSPFEQRPIDLLVPMTVGQCQTIEEILSGYSPGSDSQKLASATYENLKENRTEYPLNVLRRTMRELLSRDIPTEPEKKKFLFGIFGMLSDIETCVRVERRIKFLTQLLKDVRGKRVMVINRGLPDSINTEDVTVQPPVDAISLGKLMRNSKMVAHCHPTYPNALHERIINGMACGSVVISDFAPCLEASFRNQEELLWTDTTTGLNEILAGLDPNRLPDIAQNAYDRAWTDFSPRKHMDLILEGMGFPIGSVA